MAANAEQILEAAAGRCDGAEVFMQSGETRSVNFENNRLKRGTARQYRGVGLRVLVEGRIGFASTTDLRKPDALVEMALESARYGEPARFELPGSPDDLPEVPTEDPAVGEVSLQQMVEIGRQGLAMSREESDEYLFSAGISTRCTTEQILNTAGLHVSYTRTDMAGQVEVQEVGDDGLLQVYEFKSWGRPFESIKEETQTVLEKMKTGQKVVPAPAEAMPVVFTPKAAGNLVNPVLTALSGKRVQKGSSVLAGRIGEQVLDEQVSIFDDATLPYAPGSGPIDDEGLPTRRVPLIENGVLKHYLLDLQTAALLEMEPTASGYRSYAKRPSPSSSNTVLEGGGDSYEEMVSGMERGLIVDQTLGSGQSNTLAGEFSVNVSLGFLVEDGQVTGRAKDCMVAGNVYDLFGRLEGLGEERTWMGSDYLPAICVGGIKVASQG